ncbi:hypothetical protein [Viridibacterium curvum]|uniref:Uncharacterized protein n=1 Tax=Viridibacterium curvum TaxID=1101404 RepID=A0ABP9R3J1_9RHOO
MYSLGAIPRRLRDMPASLQPALSEYFAPQADQLRFLTIPPGSPLWGSGDITPQDRLLGISEKLSNTPIEPGWGLKRSAATEVVNDELNLSILRDGAEMQIAARPQMMCNMPITLLPQPGLIARAEADRLVLSTGLLRYARNDDEVALLLATSLAYKLLPAHLQRDAASARLEADYLAGYVLVRAGYDLPRATRIWLHLATASDASELRDLMPEHKISVQRLANLQRTAKEIQRKQTARKPVFPDIAWVTAGELKAASAQATPAPSSERNAPSTEEALLTDVTRIPFISNSGVVGYQRFLNTPVRPRAFAIAPTGAWSYKTGASAANDALTHCSLLAKGEICYLYAVDERVVWNVATAAEAPQAAAAQGKLQNLRAPKASGYATISDLAAVPLSPGNISAYQAFLEKPAPRAIVITQEGRARYWIGPGSLEYALTWCERQSEQCWLYAVDDTVVWDTNPARRIKARSQLAPAGGESMFLDTQ